MCWIILRPHSSPGLSWLVSGDRLRRKRNDPDVPERDRIAVKLEANRARRAQVFGWRRWRHGPIGTLFRPDNMRRTVDHLPVLDDRTILHYHHASGLRLRVRGWIESGSAVFDIVGLPLKRGPARVD